MREAAKLDRAWTRVVRTQNCSGCGACTRLDPGLSMAVDDDGYSRPVRIGAARPRTGAARIFTQICPGRRVDSPRPAGAKVHPSLGPIVSSWQAWAGDPAVRHRGSSGGALTALIVWLIDTGEVAACTAVRADPEAPRRTVPVTITTRAEALEAAGSRYAPVATLSDPDALRPGRVLVAKPCEISAARQSLRRDEVTDRSPLLLSFFCAGTPSQHATERLLGDLGLPDDRSCQRALVPRTRLAGPVHRPHARRRGGVGLLRRVLGPPSRALHAVALQDLPGRCRRERRHQCRRLLAHRRPRLPGFRRRRRVQCGAGPDPARTRCPHSGFRRRRAGRPSSGPGRSGRGPAAPGRPAQHSARALGGDSARRSAGASVSGLRSPPSRGRFRSRDRTDGQGQLPARPPSGGTS